jgi:U3 small nucleolar ribonucleoprotein protein IMP4
VHFCLALAASDRPASTAYEIRLGTLEQVEAEREWVLAHYSRTAKKRRLLSVPGPSAGLSAPAKAASSRDDEEHAGRKRRR